MDPGNDPGRDEYGLPPVDVEIPDDARDLERDVQAYHRELRALRRQSRVRRLTGPLTRHGMIMPLVAACLAVTLLTGTLLTVLAGRRVPLLPGRGPFSTAPLRTAPASTGPKSTAPQSTAPRSTPARAPAQASGGLQLPSVPDVQVILGNAPVSLRTLAPAVLAWIPTSCGCSMALRELAKQAAAAKVPFYLVGNSAAVVAQLPVLASQARTRNRPGVVNDTQNAISITYQPAGLTAILAHADYSVGALDVVRHLDSAQRLA
ncbi:MAG: hypothetical protein ACREQ5_23850, partial [Candidatus Dormibacteria bacterium]